MTVSRRVEIAYDAPDDETADWLADMIRRFVMNEQWPAWDDMDRALTNFTITGQSFTAEPVIPSPEPLVDARGD